MIESSSNDDKGGIVTHLIVEGPDGSGKDTLINGLMTYKRWPEPFTRHPRASTSIGGPVKNLVQWVVEDIPTMRTNTPQIYNRHPLVSEDIYWRARGAHAPLISPRERRELIPHVARNATLIICQPPFHVALETIRRQGPDAHMPGVFHNYVNIYNAYSTLVWPGRVVRYDYTRDSYTDLITTLRKASSRG